MAIVRDFLKSMNLNPEEILSKEAQAMPHRTVIDYSHQPSEQEQIDTMLRALMHKLKQDIIAETREISQKKNGINYSTGMVARERFELSSRAPEAPMLDHYTTGLQSTPKHGSLLLTLTLRRFTMSFFSASLTCFSINQVCWFV
jgi:hypothetical protein